MMGRRMPKVLQHPFNCNMWRHVDKVSAMPKEECSMVTGIVITADLEITAASVFCTLKHLKKRKVCWMIISMSHVLLRTSHFQWWRKGVHSFLTFWQGKKAARKRVKALWNYEHHVFRLCSATLFHFKVQSVAHIMLHLCDSVTSPS